MDKKFAALTLSSIVFVTCLMTGCKKDNNAMQNKSDGEKHIYLRLADNQSEGYVTVKADIEFSRIVEEKSNGRIKVDVYPGGQLGDEKGTLEQVQFGAIDLIRVSTATLSEIDSKMGVLILPYIYRNQEHMFKVLDGPIGSDIMAGLEDYNLVGLCWFDAGARNIYNTKKDIKSPEDLKGLKIRVQENKIMADMIRALGGTPTPMPYGEVYSGLKTGVIDGAENNWLSYTSTDHFEVANHITIGEFTRVPEMIVASKINLDKLSKEDQKIIKEAAIEASKYQRAEWLKNEEEAKKRIADRGVIITKLDNDNIEEFKEKLMVLYDTYGKEFGELIKDIINTN